MNWKEFYHRKVYLWPKGAGWIVYAPEQTGLWFWTI